MNEAFLTRWSKRKQGLAPETPAQPDPAEALEPQAPSEPAAEQQSSTDTGLTDADMPDLDSLNDESDVSMFFAKGVSQALRQKALRKLFHQPSYNTISELDEYIEDYSQLTRLSQETADKMHSLVKDKLNEWLETASDDAPSQAPSPADTTLTSNKENQNDEPTNT